MRLIFAGTPDFATPTLGALIESEHEIVAVLTQPDRPAGRGLKIKTSPVKTLAQYYQLKVYQPSSLKDSRQLEILEQLNADALIVVAYGLLLPAKLLHVFPFGCINIHPSLLPRWRGAAPIQRAILAGDTITGVSIMKMDQGLDTGPIFTQYQYLMDPNETSQSLHDALANLGARALLETLDLLVNQKIEATPQNPKFATYAPKVCKEEALIDWNLSAIEIELAVRAFNPWPVAFTTWHGQHLRIWKAKALNKGHISNPRIIMQANQQGIDIATEKGVLRLLEVQLPGGKKLSSLDFYNARRLDLIVGERFD